MKAQPVKLNSFSTIATAQVLMYCLSAAADVSFTSHVIDNNFYGDCKAVGDLDGDNLTDVVIGRGQLIWYRYPNWSKTVIANADNQFTTDMQVGDVDKDGDLDIIVPDGNSGNNVLWFENPRPGGNPAAGSWTRHIIGAQSGYVHDVEVGDVNGDSLIDVVTRGLSGPTYVYFQNTPTSWSRVTISTASDGEGTALADIDRDGDLDIVENGYWLQNPLPGGNPQSGGSWTRRNIASGWPDLVGVTTADLNQDNRPDVLLAHSESTGRMVWYEGPADPINGNWVEHPIDSSVDFVHTFKMADINLDGQLDVVFAEMAQSSRKRVGFFLNGGGGQSWQLQVLSTSGSHNIRVADFGGDGDIDIVGANWQGPPVQWWENLQGGIITPPTTPTNITATVNGNTLVLSWPESHLGWALQTNNSDAADPDAWSAYPGSTSVTSVNVPMDPTTEHVYFRLMLP